MRDDVGVYEGVEVPIYYDPMLGQADRLGARTASRRSTAWSARSPSCASRGSAPPCRSSAPCCADADFRSGNLDIGMLDRKLGRGRAAALPVQDVEPATCRSSPPRSPRLERGGRAAAAPPAEAPARAGAWPRGATRCARAGTAGAACSAGAEGSMELIVTVGERKEKVRVDREGERLRGARSASAPTIVDLAARAAAWTCLRIDGEQHEVAVLPPRARALVGEHRPRRRARRGHRPADPLAGQGASAATAASRAQRSPPTCRAAWSPCSSPEGERSPPARACSCSRR